MAATWRITTQYPDIETDGSTTARNVIVTGGTVTEHEVYIEFRWPRGSFKLQNARDQFAGYAVQFDMLYRIPGMDTVTWGQRLNSANQLEDILTIYVISTSGDSADYIVFPFRRWTQPAVASAVKAKRDALDAAEASEGEG
jgi:hypothetical protein